MNFLVWIRPQFETEIGLNLEYAISNNGNTSTNIITIVVFVVVVGANVHNYYSRQDFLVYS